MQQINAISCITFHNNTPAVFEPMKYNQFVSTGADPRVWQLLLHCVVQGESSQPRFRPSLRVSAPLWHLQGRIVHSLYAGILV
jgi:hypothetical protein